MSDRGARFLRAIVIAVGVLVGAETVARLTDAPPAALPDPYDVRLETATGVTMALEGGALRLRRDPEVGLALVPDQVLQGVMPDGRHATVKVNAQGFRGDDWRRERPAGRVRVIVFGGATAFGAGCASDSETVAANLERLLGPMVPDGRSIEVWNAGIPGYDSARALTLMGHRLLEWGPDALVLLDGWTDFCRGLTAPTSTALVDPLFAEEDALCATRLGGWKQDARGLAVVRRLLGTGTEGARADRLSLNGSGAEVKGAFSGREVLPDRPDASVRYYRNLQRIGALAKGAGVKLVLATEPELFLRAAPVPKEEQALREALPQAYANRARIAYPRFATAAAAVARETGAVAVDCSAAFDGHGDSIFMGPSRIADRGCGLVAEKIAPTLLHILFEEKK